MKKDFEHDFLTSRGRDDKPVHLAALNVTLQPLRFIEFSIEDLAPSVLLTARSPLVAILPSPARYAVHKLIVCAERPERMRSRARSAGGLQGPFC